MAEVIDDNSPFEKPTDNEKELVEFVVDHTDRWREYRNQNFLDEWEKYDRIFRGEWASTEKTRDSERSKIISPASQQAVETSHAETMEAIFGQGEFFDIKDDLRDQNGPIDIEMLKKQLYEDFAQDKIRKSIDQIGLMAKIYGTGIGEITVSKTTGYRPKTIPLDNEQSAYGVQEYDRISVKLTPVNPKNFLFDPNGTCIDDCMGVATERFVSVHKVMEGIQSGKYRKVDLTMATSDDKLEPTQETTQFQDDKVQLLTYYGLVPKEYLDSLKDDESYEKEEIFNDAVEDYADMVEAIIVIANGSQLLKAEESPYMMKDRPVISYQDDTVPNRLLGRGVMEKALNMQIAIDGSMRTHMDSLSLTAVPMVALDATRLPRGAKFEVKPGKAFLTNGAPQEIIHPFNFGTTDGNALNASKEFERMLLMSTSTLDSQGMVSTGGRDDNNMTMAVAGLIKKQKRTLVNFQEDFLIPFIYKATWRFMQFDPERYPAVDVKFIPTATLGIMAREHEQKQLAFMIQTLGADSPITPILMKGVLKNSSLSSREEIIAQLEQMSQPNPQQQAMQQQMADMEMKLKEAMANESQAKANMNNALAQLDTVKAMMYPDEARANIVAAASKNLPDQDAQANAEFERRIKVAELMLKEKDIDANNEIVRMQTAVKASEQANNSQYMDEVKKIAGG